MRLRLLALFLIAGTMGVTTGCNRLPEGEPIAETSEPGYEEGKRLMRQGREQEAVAAFFEVIESREDGAPESHLEVGLIYLLEIKDPVAAIYHFRQFLKLNPNSPQADLVEQRIVAAKREFARSLPAQPLENQVLRNDLLDVVEALQRENAQLKDDLAVIRGNATRPASNTARGAVADLNVNRSRLRANPLTSVPLSDEEQRQLPRPTRPAEVVDSPAATSAQAARPAASPLRVHIVVKGDTLYNLSRRFYGSPSRAVDIFSANRNIMRSQNDLQIGMQLVIPE